MKRFLNKKFIVLFVLAIFSLANFVMADGWVNDGYGNWLYEENGEYLKATVKTIDGINYYFDTKGYWLPTENLKPVKMSGSEMVSFTIEGKDYSNRNYKTKITLPRPIVSGENEEVLNEFIKNEFEKAVGKYYEEHSLSILFLTPEIKIDNIFEIYNLHDVIGFGYIGGGMFNLYLDTKKLELWAQSNRN